MPPLLQTVKAKASPFFNNLSNQKSGDFTHTVGMDKNGGPNQLKAWREFNKLSQQDLADAVGSTVGMISLLESGSRGLSAKWLRKLAPVLKTRPGHILDTNPNDLDNDVIEIWTRINLDDRPTALRVLKSLTRGNGG